MNRRIFELSNTIIQQQQRIDRQTDRRTFHVNLRSLRNESYRFVSNHRSTTYFREIYTGFSRTFSRRNRNRINISMIFSNDLLIEVIDRSLRFRLHELNQRFVQIIKMTISAIDGPFESTMLYRDTVSKEECHTGCSLSHEPLPWLFTYR